MDKPVSAVAIRFILDYLKDSAVLVGVKTPQQILSNIEATGWNLSENQMNILLDASAD